MRHFEEKESYLHKLAKDVLKGWIESYPERFGLTNVTSVRLEEKFAENGIILFVPDLCVYQGSELTHIYEICHKNGITGYKLHKIQWYCFTNYIKMNVLEIDATYIMRQIKCPENIKMINFGIYNDGELF